MSNALLTKRLAEYRALATKIETEQAKYAADGATAPTEEAVTAMRSDRETAQKLAEEITELGEHETRAAAVGTLAASLGTGDTGDGAPDDGNGDGADGGVRSAARTAQRDPGHYRSVADGGANTGIGFFSDLFKAGQKNPEAEAQRRLAEHTAHMRAIGTTGGGSGITPPKWLMDEYLKMGRQTRIVANLVRNVPLGDDPRPLVLPKQTAQTDQNFTAQTTEGTNNTATWGADRFATGDDTLTPLAYGAYQDVSRQLLGVPGATADVLIMQDLSGAWDFKMEGIVCAAILAGGTAFTTYASDATNWLGAAPAMPAIDGVVDMQTAVANALYGPADIAIMNYSRFGKFRKIKDTTGHYVMPVTKYGPNNAAGALGNVLVGDIEGVDAYASAGVPGTATPSSEKYAVLRSQSVLFAESNVLEFNYEQVVGPSSVRMGVFGYAAALVRVPLAVQIATVTAA